MKFSIDVSGLTAGDVIEQPQCEQVIGFARNENKYEYQFALMQLVDYVMKLLWKDGRKLTVVSDGGSVKVLTHQEASEYNAARFEGANAKMRRCHQRLLAVDCGSFDVDALHYHNQSIIKTSSILSAIKSTRATIRVEPYKSNEPKMIKVGSGR